MWWRKIGYYASLQCLSHYDVRIIPSFIKYLMSAYSIPGTGLHPAGMLLSRLALYTCKGDRH